MKQHFVTFYSPGTLCSEYTTKPIDSWDVATAVKMADSVLERHGATPYGFRFSTRERGDDELDSHVAAESYMYFLGGRVLTLEDVKREMPNERILIMNMESNGYSRIIINDNSWRAVQPLYDTDVVLQYTPPTRQE